MPEVPAACALSGKCRAGEAPGVSRLGLLGQAGARLRRSARGSADPRACSSGAWSEPHGKNVHGRPLGRFPLQGALRGGFRESGNLGSARRWARAEECIYFAATLRCAPPANKPLPDELANCRPYFERELDLLRPRAIFALGGIAMRAYLALLKDRGQIQSYAAFPFRHGASYKLPGDLPRLFVSYHPSQQNTFTGKLTEMMLASVLRDIRQFLDSD